MNSSAQNLSSVPVRNHSHLYVGDHIPEPARSFFIVLGVFLMISGTLGNILVLVTLAKCPSLHSLHYVYVANLAVADLIIEAYSSPFVMYDLMLGFHPVLNRAHCVFNGFLVVTCYVSSLFTLASISFNRYMNVCQNAIYNRYVTRKLTLGLLVLVWVISAAVASGPLIGWGRYGYDAKTHYCGYERTASFSYTILIAAGTIGAPAMAVCYFNFSIFRANPCPSYVTSEPSTSQNHTARLIIKDLKRMTSRHHASCTP
ncbi:hypothetical protein RRG08_050683 [Elysia crispata]|uniref:G-protein coupled receptors family 1 profile domain-containing protein n=1 Tax=Elysia crispata TaxID=231223 RepID=A0AAE1A5N3_9GAST|nr:hypothetical protein RRG08_050683 [Elysia crispata]